VLRDIDGIRNILDLSKNTGVKRVFYSSSSEVYGEPVEFPQNESTTPLNSRLPYAIVKNVGESFFKSYKREYGLDYTIFRFFNTYGPRQSADFVIPRFIDLATRNLPLIIYGDGFQSRTFCYIDDNVDATIAVMENDLFVDDVVNIGNDKELSVLELANKIVTLAGSRSEIRHVDPLEEGDMTRRMPDITKMRSVLRRDLIDIDKGLLLTYEAIVKRNSFA
jgi:UDP-glucose 4-epimerase